jgi:hypothetical protein
MRVEDGLDVPEAVVGEGCDLRHGRLGKLAGKMRKAQLLEARIAVDMQNTFEACKVRTHPASVERLRSTPCRAKICDCR